LTFVCTSLAQSLPRCEAATFVLRAPERTVLSLDGIDHEGLRILLDEVEPERDNRRALFARLAPALTTEEILEQVIQLFAETALQLWPMWFTDVNFAGCRDDILGQLSVNLIARSAAGQITGLSSSWAEAAARLALVSRTPRVKGTLATIELGQLARAISRSGLILIWDVDEAVRLGPNPAALVHALEWIAQHSPHGTVVALFTELPPNVPPFDRILYGARTVVADNDSILNAPVGAQAIKAAAAEVGPWIAPWRGLPHPLSEVEQRLAKALSADAELAPLFGFNQSVETVRGSRPRVDLVWTIGRLVVELDGYSSHGNRTAFLYDRHRDYELTLSGYTVLRLANDEIAQDLGKAIEKKATSRASSRVPRRACASTSTSTRRTARSCSRTPASSGSKASCRSGGIRHIVRGARRIGSSRKTRTHPQ
jgi:very-short-patch-repair endonuclease